MDVDLFINVIKRPEFVCYKGRVGPQSASIAYVGSQALSSDSNISIEDKSGFIHSNKIFQNIITHFENENVFSSPVDNFLITDQYNIVTDSSGSLKKTPLFYKHKLKHFVAGDEVKNIKIFDDLMNEVIVSDFILDSADGLYYSNLESFYDVTPDNIEDPDATEYTFYYIQYTLRNTAQKTFVELINNKEVFREATWEDFNEDNLLNPGTSAYLLEVDPLSGGFSITLPAPTTFSYIIKERKRLRCLWPTSKDHSVPWYIRVTNGRVQYENLPRYQISPAQFLAQDFDPIFGIKRILKEPATVINKKVIKVGYENLHQDSGMELFIDLTIVDEDGNDKGKFSTNEFSTPSGYVVWNITDRLGIKSIDDHTGFIEIEGVDLAATDIILCDYYYLEDKYEFTKIDFNPISNGDILKYRTLIFIDPTPNADDEETLKFIQFNLDGTSITQGGLNHNDWMFLETIQGEHLTPSSSGVTGSKANFVLAEIIVGEGKGIRDSVTLDVRVPGGGIKESKAEEVEKAHPDYDHFWDQASWDGKPYPGNLCYHLQVPIKGLIKGAGGEYSFDQIQPILTRHASCGAYGVTRGYGIDAKIKNIEFAVDPSDSTKTQATVVWNGVDSYTYHINHRESGAEWGAPQATDAGVANSHIVKEREVTLSGLTPNLIYEFAVIGVEEIAGADTELITQHINKTNSGMKTLTDELDSLQSLQVFIPSLG
jgi:hypothetical protein